MSTLLCSFFGLSFWLFAMELALQYPLIQTSPLFQKGNHSVPLVQFVEHSCRTENHFKFTLCALMALLPYLIWNVSLLVLLIQIFGLLICSKDDQTAHNQTFFNQPANNEGITVVSSATKNHLPTYEVFITVQKPNRLEKYWCELRVDKQTYASYNWPYSNGVHFTDGLCWAVLLLSLLKLSHF